MKSPPFHIPEAWNKVSLSGERLAWVSGVSGGKGEGEKRKREGAKGEEPSSPSPLPLLTSPLLSPSPLGRPDTQANERSPYRPLGTLRNYDGDVNGT